MEEEGSLLRRDGAAEVKGGEILSMRGFDLPLGALKMKQWDESVESRDNVFLKAGKILSQ